MSPHGGGWVAYHIHTWRWRLFKWVESHAHVQSSWNNSAAMRITFAECITPYLFGHDLTLRIEAASFKGSHAVMPLDASVVKPSQRGCWWSRSSLAVTWLMDVMTTSGSWHYWLWRYDNQGHGNTNINQRETSAFYYFGHGSDTPRTAHTSSIWLCYQAYSYIMMKKQR